MLSVVHSSRLALIVTTTKRVIDQPTNIVAGVATLYNVQLLIMGDQGFATDILLVRLLKTRSVPH